MLGPEVTDGVVHKARGLGPDFAGLGEDLAKDGVRRVRRVREAEIVRSHSKREAPCRSDNVLKGLTGKAQGASQADGISLRLSEGVAPAPGLLV